MSAAPAVAPGSAGAAAPLVRRPQADSSIRSAIAVAMIVVVRLTGVPLRVAGAWMPWGTVTPAQTRRSTRRSGQKSSGP